MTSRLKLRTFVIGDAATWN